MEWRLMRYTLNYRHTQVEFQRQLERMAKQEIADYHGILIMYVYKTFYSGVKQGLKNHN
jgi:hypothetical protein